MYEYKETIPTMSVDYLREVKQRLRSMTPRAIAGHVRSLVAEHDDWRRKKCLNMMAAENTISRRALELLSSDLATRVTEGFPGAKLFPPPKQNIQIDEIEATIIALSRRLCRSEYVEWRALNTTMANAVVLFALTQPGDVIMSQSIRGGGNMSYHLAAIPGLRGLRVEDIPPTRDYGIELESLRAQALQLRPKLLVIGGSNFLFPFPLKELREIADEVGALILYDAAHVGLLIAAGIFQDPLAEGADVLTVSTHKVMGGPVGGLILTNNKGLAEKMLNLTFPSFMQTRDQNKYAASAHALAEMVEFGESYARQMVANARTLAVSLEQEGFNVLFKDRGYTMTHQVTMDCRNLDAARVERVCQESNILVHKTPVLGDELTGVRTGLRITVQEITRQGMKEPEMGRIAGFMARVVLHNEVPNRIAAEIEEFLRDYQRVQYSFDDVEQI